MASHIELYPIAARLDLSARLLKFDQYGLKDLRVGFAQANATASYRGCHQKRPGFNSIGQNREFGSANRIDALDCDSARAGAAYFGTHTIQKFGQVSHLWFARRILEDGFPVGQDSRHHEIFGACDGDGIEDDAGPHEAFCTSVNVAVFNGHACPHSLQPLNVKIDGSSADRAPSGQ